MAHPSVASSSTVKEASPYTILLVGARSRGDDPVRALLTAEGHQVLCAVSGQEALNVLSQQRVHLLLVDYVLPDMTGIEVTEECRRVNDLVQVVLRTAEGNTCPPHDLLRTLSIQGYHDASDGMEKLLEWVNLACRSYSVLERTRRSEHLKSQLVANVSHELRTPLNVILGYIELMREGVCGEQPPEAAEALVTINRQGLILLHLINDLLDMSKLQAGAMHVTRERVCVSEIVDEFRDVLAILVAGAEVAVRWEVPCDLYGVADPAKVRLVVQNLISNAAKFTSEGEIVVRLEAAGNELVLSVRDTGPGIDPKNHERIFELFEQAEPHDPCRQGGTGIGLYLARALSRLMGGELTVESAPGNGSIFSFRLLSGESGSAVASLP